MNYNEDKRTLYRWERQSKPKVYSRSQRVASNDDIQDWIKTVEVASIKATDAAFGVVQSGKERGRAAAHAKRTQVRAQEEAHTEAQELLNQWVKDKIHFDEDDGFDDLEAWRRARNLKKIENGSTDTQISHGIGARTAAAEKTSSNWPSDRSLDSSWEIDETAIYERVKRAAVGDEDPYAGLLEMDEKDAVSSVLQAMMRKEVVKDTFKKDVDDSEINIPDPRTKMELRHRMVKENREKRQTQEKKQMTEKQMKKEARLSAQQIVFKEQREKDNKVKKEEAEIKKEMTKIRKDLADENRRKEEILRRDREEKELMARLAKEEYERQKRAEEDEMLLSHRSESERKKRQMIKEEIWRTKQGNKRLKTLHTHFTAWYNLVLSRRLLMGKVKAMSDWKVTVKVWSAWKSYVRGQRAQVEAVHHEQQVINSHRKALMADRHYTSRLLRQCLAGWKIFIHVEFQRKAAEEEKEKTKAKMMALLTAVAEGKVNNEKETESNVRNKLSKKDNSGSPREETVAANQVEDLSTSNSTSDSNRPTKPIQAWLDENDDLQQQQQHRPSSAASSSSHHASTNARRRQQPLPSQPWQVTKKHVIQMDAQDIRDLGHNYLDADQEEGTSARSHYTDADIRKRFGTQPWMNRQYVVNNFEHRYNAQQRALREQQDQIKEQRQMIEELKYQNNNKLMKQQLKSGGSLSMHGDHKDIEVPPRGKHIPHDDTQLDQVDENGKLEQEVTANTNNNNDDRLAQKPTLMNESDHHSVGQVSNTDRSSLTSSRSRQPSSVVSLPQGPQGNTKYLQVLQNMEERAAQRARQKAERDGKRRKQEEEKLAELERQELERLKQIEDEKKARVEAFRQKKRLEKQKDEDRHREAARQQELTQKAEEHYTRSLLKYRCLLPLKKLVGMSKRNWVKAVKHHDDSILRRMLKEWKLFSDTEQRRKQQMADQMTQFLLVKHSFQRWKKYKYHSEFLLKRADRHYQTSLKIKLIRTWTEFVGLERETTARNEETAHEHYLKYLLRSSFLAWRYLPEQQKREEERKKRKVELRQRVAQLIPDYVPCATPAASQDLLD